MLALAVLWLARSWWPLPVAAVAALAVVLGFAALGFAWWEAYPVLVDRYWDGIAATRPCAYWVWGNLGALLVSAGRCSAPGWRSPPGGTRPGADRRGAGRAAAALTIVDRRPEPDVEGRGGADLAAVRAVADALARAAARWLAAVGAGAAGVTALARAAPRSTRPGEARRPHGVTRWTSPESHAWTRAAASMTGSSASAPASTRSSHAPYHAT